MHSAMESKKRNIVTEEFAKLTFTKMKVIEAVIDRTAKEAGDDLFVSKRTIDFHLAELYRLFKVHGKEDLMKELQRYGMIKFEPEIEKDMAA